MHLCKVLQDVQLFDLTAGTMWPAAADRLAHMHKTNCHAIFSDRPTLLGSSPPSLCQPDCTCCPGNLSTPESAIAAFHDVPSVACMCQVAHWILLFQRRRKDCLTFLHKSLGRNCWHNQPSETHRRSFLIVHGTGNLTGNPALPSYAIPGAGFTCHRK